MTRYVSLSLSLAGTLLLARKPWLAARGLANLFLIFSFGDTRRGRIIAEIRSASQTRRVH